MFEHGWQMLSDRVEIASKNVEHTIATLLSASVSLEGLHVKSANLDDLFLKLTGHSLHT